MRVWRVFITPSAEHTTKKLPTPVATYILEDFPDQVRSNPFIGNQLSGSLAWLRSFHFSIDGTRYRIAYAIDEKASTITLHYAGPRPGFYERLKRHLP